MITLLLHLFRVLPFLFGSHRQLALENLALRQQLAVYKRTVPRPRLRTTDRLLWAGLARVWARWRQSLVIVTPDTVLRWQQRHFREYWTRLSGIDEVLTAPHSPWQNPFAERLIGSIRRECLNHVLVLGERHLHRILARYFEYYHRTRTHLSLDKDAPDLRPVELSEAGGIVEIPEVGGLHHRYARRAA